MKKNGGFTLIELIVVVAILAIMSVGTVSAMGYMTLANSNKCASKIDSGLTVLKSKNMSKAEPTYMYIYMINGNYYIDYYTGDNPADFTPSENGQVIANNQLVVSKDSTPIEGTDDMVCIGINRKDGSFKNTLLPTSEIVISGKSSKKVVLVSSTGKHYID